MAKIINIRPTTGVYATYKNIKYDAWTAIAEFVDNSTQSFYDHEKILENLEICITYKSKNDSPYLEIRDNAYGMNFEDFKRAIILDSKPKVATRSEFGMGLKTAACWFGKNWSVETVELNSGKKYKANIDVERLSKTKEEEITYEESECDKNEHGTIVKIWNLNRKLFGRQIQKTKDKLRGMYRVDLRTGKIKIYYDGGSGIDLLSYSEPEIYEEQLPDGSKKIWKENVSFSINNDDGKNYNVNGFIGILKKGSTYSAGFTLIRRGRVIIGGYEDCYRPKEIFGASNGFAYQRVFGELNLDNWPVTQTKDSFDWYNGLEDELIKKLEKETKKFREKSENIRKEPKKVTNIETREPIESFSKAGIIQNLKINPLEESNIAVIQAEIIPEIQNEPKSLFLEDTQNQKINVDSDLESEEKIEITGNKNSKISFDCSGEKYSIFLKQITDNPNEKWLKIINGESKNPYEFTVEWNIVHPFFKSYLEKQETYDVLKKFIFAFVLSEKKALSLSSDGKIAPEDIRVQMNETLKEVMTGTENGND